MQPDLDWNDASPPPALLTPAMERAVELARELLRERGLSDEEIEDELERPPGSGLALF